MAQIIPFYVDDTSPTISYSPFRDTLSIPNLTAGWNPYFESSGFATAPGQVGVGRSYHVTSLDNASLSITWAGTGIQLLGFTNHSDYAISLDGAIQNSFGAASNNNVLATFQGLTNTTHTISLIAQIPVTQSPLESTVFFDKALILSVADAPVNTSYAEKSLDNIAISFIGHWLLVNETGHPFYLSSSAGDIAQTTFTGASLFVSGGTSPRSGEYSVTLDNATTTLSGRSSFTQRDTLLFYASDLDPESIHDVQIVNRDGGELALNVDGFKVFTRTHPILPPSPSATKSSGVIGGGIPMGTIAALVLAGILTCFIFSGFLYCFCVVRPRRNRARKRTREAQTRRATRVRKAREGGDIMDIGRDFALVPEPRTTETNSTRESARRQSGRSGFARWKREVEGGLNGLGIGIVFRHSNPPVERNGKHQSSDYPREKEPSSARTSPFSLSSVLRSKSGIDKGEKAKSKSSSESSWSPSFTLELPIRGSYSLDVQDDRNIGRSRPVPGVTPSAKSGLTSLSYVSAPPLPAIPPPSYAISDTKGDSNHNSGSGQSFPRTVSHSSSNGHDRQGGTKLLPRSGEPNVGSPDKEAAGGDAPIEVSFPPPFHRAHDAPSVGVHEDRGSVQDGSDDSASYLGPAATQIALRSLSPQTSGYLDQIRGLEHTAPSEPPVPESFPTGLRPIFSQKIQVWPSGIGDQTSFLDVRGDQLQSDQIDATPQEVSLSPSLEVIVPSPFTVDFSNRVPEQRNMETGGADTSEQQNLEKLRNPPKLRSPFRLTPSNMILSTMAPRNEGMSFLDLSNSSDSSYRTQPVTPASEVSGYDRPWTASSQPESGPSQGPQLRWSNPLTQTIDRLPSEPPSPVLISPTSAQSVFFPYPVSLPLSPPRSEGHVDSPDQPQMAVSFAIPPGAGTGDTQGVHPIPPGASRPDSMPVSITELRFRHSQSTEDSSGASLNPPHPPLPSSSREQSESDAVTGPSFIVQHVLRQTASLNPVLSRSPLHSAK